MRQLDIEALPTNESLAAIAEKYAIQKKTINEDSWKNNVRKRLRASGQPYKDHRGNEKSGRKVQPLKCKCFHGCTQKITEEQRQGVHAYFWSLDDKTKQIFYNNNLKSVKPIRRYTNKDPIRHRNVLYYLPIEGEQQRVCSNFFCKTLDISSKRCRVFLSKKGDIEENPKLKGCYLDLLFRNIDF